MSIYDIVFPRIKELIGHGSANCEGVSHKYLNSSKKIVTVRAFNS